MGGGHSAERWTIDALGERVAAALEDADGPSNGQVRAIPDRRTIRYYTTLGLLDRPAEMRGRTALYGQRHLLQVVAIKRLQAEGLSLTAVQERLTGATDGMLRRIAGIPADLDARVDASAAEAPEAKPVETARRGGAFWMDVPDATESALPDETNFGAVAPVRESERRTSAMREGKALAGIALSDEVTLVWPSARPLTEEDVRALARAAGPLITILKERGLWAPELSE